MCQAKVCIPKFITQRAPAAAGEIAKFWQPGQVLTVSFMDATTEQEEYAVASASEWMKHMSLTFDFITKGNGQVRIAFDDRDGAWSYIGRDIFQISKSKPTMNLGWTDGGVGEHEFGHTLGLIHEHQNPDGGIRWDRDAVIKDLSGPPNYWDLDTIEFNIFETYSRDSINGTKVDPKSIMMYSIPDEWTLDGFQTGWNTILSDTDKAFISSIYHPLVPEESGELIDVLRRIFKSEKELVKLRKLYESNLVAIGEELGLPTDEKLSKKENYELIRALVFR